MVLAAAVAVLAFAAVAWLIYSGQNRKRRVDQTSTGGPNPKTTITGRRRQINVKRHKTQILP
jgi:hypothetical protein